MIRRSLTSGIEATLNPDLRDRAEAAQIVLDSLGTPFVWDVRDLLVGSGVVTNILAVTCHF
jgi:hypothetical protein